MVEDQKPVESTEDSGVKNEVSSASSSPAPDIPNSDEPNLIEQAKLENDRREKLLEEEKKLQERKEKLYAEQMVGGRSLAGGIERKEKKTPEEIANDFRAGKLGNPFTSTERWE